MQVGALFPQLELGDDPGAIRDWAQMVEGLGYTYILVYEHVLGFRDTPAPSILGPLLPEATFHEPFVLFGYLAALTERVGLATGVLVLPQRPTALVAKQAAAADVLSGGRLRLGVGAGYVPSEFRALGAEYHTRGARLTEQLAVLRALWTEQVVTFSGRWHQLEAAGLSPLPVQRPIPLWMGGMSAAALRRAATLADGWLSVLTTPSAAALDRIAQLQAAATAAGRPRDAVGVDVHLPLRTVPPAQWATTAATWRAVGVTHLSVDTMGAGFTTPAQHLAALEQVAHTLLQ